MSEPKIIIREGKREDLAEVMSLINELAIFEKSENDVAMTEEELLRHGFNDQPDYWFFVAEVDGVIQGMAFYYYCFSTWRGKYLYLEDLVVRESARKTGIGSMLFETLIQKAKSEGLRQMGWQVLDWNIPAIQFYEKHGASLDNGWMNGRIYFES